MTLDQIKDRALVQTDLHRSLLQSAFAGLPSDRPGWVEDIRKRLALWEDVLDAARRGEVTAQQQEFVQNGSSLLGSKQLLPRD